MRYCNFFKLHNIYQYLNINLLMKFLRLYKKLKLQSP